MCAGIALRRQPTRSAMRTRTRPGALELALAAQVALGGGARREAAGDGRREQLRFERRHELGARGRGTQRDKQLCAKRELRLRGSANRHISRVKMSWACPKFSRVSVLVRLHVPSHYFEYSENFVPGGPCKTPISDASAIGDPTLSIAWGSAVR